ncbi:hypothetical protein BDFG_04035, partial [Blastomyces dermatitidis ATCC 26199]
METADKQGLGGGRCVVVVGLHQAFVSFKPAYVCLPVAILIPLLLAIHTLQDRVLRSYRVQSNRQKYLLFANSPSHPIRMHPFDNLQSIYPLEPGLAWSDLVLGSIFPFSGNKIGSGCG